MSGGRLHLHLNLGSILNLPAQSAGPKDHGPASLAHIRAAGFTGVQSVSPVAGAKEAGLEAFGLFRALTPEQVDERVRQHLDHGLAGASVHLGDGFESDREADRLVDSVTGATARTGYPLYVETHRATVTQDMRRTLDLVARHPELRLTADLSHWYTGLEMPYGDFAGKVERLAPAFARVRYMHGRIGHSCAMQVGVIRDPGAAHVQHFRALWRRTFEAFLDAAGPAERIVFAPELLPASFPGPSGPVRLNYAPVAHGEDGAELELTDRWAESLALVAIARECFDEAVAGRA
jgi:hypothetical protein